MGQDKAQRKKVQRKKVQRKKVQRKKVQGKKGVYLFVDWEFWPARPLAKAVLQQLQNHPNLFLAAVVTQHPPKTGWAALRVRLERLFKQRKAAFAQLFGRSTHAPEPVESLQHFVSKALIVKASELPTLTDHEKVLLSIFWTRRFPAETLSQFDQAVNYHNGRVPGYRGLWATSWSIYQGESHSGFTFHRMEETFDTGAVLVRGEVPILKADEKRHVEQRKTEAAVACISQVLECIASNTPGDPQVQKGRQLSTAEQKRLCNVEHTEAITGAELNLRIRAFAGVTIKHGARSQRLRFPVMPVNDVSKVQGGKTLSLADGIWVVDRRDQH